MTARILVVEDDKILRKACEVSLTKQGLAVLTASDGEEGIRQAELHMPDLILLDMRMPKLSGMDTLAALKLNEKTKSIPVVILSNSSEEADMRKAKDLGAVGYWIKASLSLHELGDRISILLSSSSG